VCFFAEEIVTFAPIAKELTLEKLTPAICGFVELF